MQNNLEWCKKKTCKISLQYLESFRSYSEKFSIQADSAPPFRLDRVKGSVIFYREGGAPENWGIRYFFLDQKGDQKIFSNKKGGSLIFFKE